jgi:hypothetical protein
MSVVALEDYDRERWQAAAAKVLERPAKGLFIEGNPFKSGNACDKCYTQTKSAWIRLSGGK